MVNKKDIELLERVYNTLLALADTDYDDADNILTQLKEYTEKQKIAYMQKLENKKAYINEKRKTNPMYGRSKLEIERYNRLHNIGGAE
jgi:tRNA(Ile)-lysidine synthase TilS/MesJ